MRLKDVIKINPDSIDSNYPFKEIEYINITSVKTGFIEKTEKMSLSKAPSRARRIVKNEDTILSTVRPNLRSFCFIKNPKKNTIVSTGFAVLRATEKIDSRFLYHTITNQEFSKYLSSRAKGAAYPAVDVEIIESAEIYLPSMLEQKKISSILSNYDDLIENNLKRIKILEIIAQKLYQEWFIHFRFSGYKKIDFKKTEFGKIPEDWDINQLSNQCKLVKEKYIDKIHKNYPLLDMARIPRKTLLVNKTGKSDEIVSSRIVFNEDDILFGSIRPYLHKVVLAPCKGVTNTSVHVIRLINKNFRSLLPIILSSDKTISWTKQHSTGLKMPIISWENFKKMPIIVPNENLLNCFDEIVWPIIEYIKLVSKINNKLIDIRELLVHELISRKLDISKFNIKIDKQVA